jgi:hypothetical protein
MPDKVAKSKEIFDNVEPEYERYYFDESTGGFVLVHERHNRGESFDSELFVAKVFATNGSQVTLLDESDAIESKRPDAEIDGEIWDFKEIRNAENMAGAVQQSIRRGKKQADNIALHLNQNFDIAKINQGVVTSSYAYREILKVAIVNVDKKQEVILMQEIRDGRRFQGF